MGQTDTIVETLKQLLRARGKTYKDVALATGLTEAGVKKSLSSESLTLRRIEDICASIGVSLGDLVRLSESQLRSDGPSFSEEQERALAADDRLFALLYLLIRDVPPDVIASRYDFGSDAELAALMGRLEDLGILARRGRKLVAASRVEPTWIRNGPLEQRYAMPLIRELLSADQSRDGRTGYMRFLVGAVSDSHYQMLMEKMKDLEVEFTAAVSRRPADSNDHKTVALFHTMQPWVFSEIEKFRRH